MGWISWAIVGILAALAIAYFFPDAARALYGVISAARGVFLTVVSILFILYFLSTGSLLLVILGVVLLMVLVWGLLFDDTIGFLEV